MAEAGSDAQEGVEKGVFVRERVGRHYILEGVSSLYTDL